MNDILQKYIECRIFIKDYEEEVIALLQNSHDNNLTVEGWRFFTHHVSKYEYTSATNDLLKFVDGVKRKERLDGTARKTYNGYRVYMRKATPPLVLDLNEK